MVSDYALKRTRKFDSWAG